MYWLKKVVNLRNVHFSAYRVCSYQYVSSFCHWVIGVCACCLSLIFEWNFLFLVSEIPIAWGAIRKDTGLFMNEGTRSLLIKTQNSKPESSYHYQGKAEVLGNLRRLKLLDVVIQNTSKLL